MEARKLTPMQIDLLRMFAFDHSDEFAKELKTIYNKILQGRIETLTDQLWQEGILDEKTIESLKTEDLHALRRHAAPRC